MPNELHDLYKADKLKLTAEMNMNYKEVKNSLYKKEWVVYAKKAFGGPDQVLEYLGRCHRHAFGIHP